MKAEGECAIWLIAPSPKDKSWSLLRVANGSGDAVPSEIGAYPSLNQAQAAAQRAEIAR